MDLPFLQAALGAIVWVVANVVYLDLKRKGIHGFTRFAAFWAGTPTTWITFFAVREGQEPAFHAPAADDEAELLAEIRRDRSLRGENAKDGRGTMERDDDVSAVSDDIEDGGGERPSSRP